MLYICLKYSYIHTNSEGTRRHATTDNEDHHYENEKHLEVHLLRGNIYSALLEKKESKKLRLYMRTLLK